MNSLDTQSLKFDLRSDLSLHWLKGKPGKATGMSYGKAGFRYGLCLQLLRAWLVHPCALTWFPLYGHFGPKEGIREPPPQVRTGRQTDRQREEASQQCWNPIKCPFSGIRAARAYAPGGVGIQQCQSCARRIQPRVCGGVCVGLFHVDSGGWAPRPHGAQASRHAWSQSLACGEATRRSA